MQREGGKKSKEVTVFCVCAFPGDLDLADFFDTLLETTTKPAKATTKPYPRKPGNSSLLREPSQMAPQTVLCCTKERKMWAEAKERN